MQIVGGADCGQDRGDVTGAEAKLDKRLEKKRTQAWPQGSQAQEGGEEEREKIFLDRSEIR